MNTHFAIRVDASTQLGSGHVMRCITLAQQLSKQSANVVFICQTLEGHLISLIQNNGFEVFKMPLLCELEDAHFTLKLLTQNHINCLIVDHYLLSKHWESQLRPHLKLLMVIDDIAREHDCDLLLDQNAQPTGRYNHKLSEGATTFLGMDFIILRDEFQNPKTTHRQQIKDLMVFFGSSDPNNISSRCLAIIQKYLPSDIHIHVITGLQNPHLDALKQHCKTTQCDLYIQTNDIHNIMHKCDFALVSGGTLTYECIAMALPCAVLSFADNQIPAAQHLHKLQLVNYLGDARSLTDTDIKQGLQNVFKHYQSHWQSIVHHFNKINVTGKHIIADWLLHGPKAQNCFLRKVKLHDCRLLWQWANDPLTRKNAFNQQTIDFDSHKIWFKQKLLSNEDLFYILDSHYGAIGQVRLDYENTSYRLSYSIAKPYRGLGLSKIMLNKLFKQLQAFAPITIKAEVKYNNKISASTLKSVGFIEQTQQIHPYHLFIKQIRI